MVEPGLKPETHTGLVPVPDPTLLTTQALADKVAGLRDIIETRLDGYDKAIVLIRDQLNREPTPSAVRGEIHQFKSVGDTRYEGLRDLYQEKFDGVKNQFDLRDVQQTRQDAARETALVNALSTAKELVEKQNISNTTAINKSEAQFAQQILQINTLIAAATENFGGKIDDLTKNLMGQIDDLKQRVGKIEGIAVGVLTNKSEVVQTTQTHAVGQNFVGMVVMAVIAVGSLAVAILKP